jgi:hypothetical protein
MKGFLVLVLVAVVALSLAEAARIRREDKYTTKYDNINVDDILASDRLIDNYFKCIMDRGKCTADGAELKCEYKTLNHLLRMRYFLKDTTSSNMFIYTAK